jgi:Tfp pilus assembly protein PilF
VSRILERLRRQRGDPPRVSPDTTHAKVVLDTLSGRRRSRAWHPPVLVASLIILTGLAILYSSRFGLVWRAPGRGTTQTTSRPPAVAARADALQPTGRTGSGAGAGKGEPPARHGSVRRGPTRPATAAAAPLQSAATRHATGRAVAAPPTSAAGAQSQPAAEADDLAGAEGHFERALQYQRSGDFENAVSQYKLVLERDQTRVEAHNNLGLLYQGRGALDDAIREFSDAIRIDPTYAQARNNRGVALLQAGNVDAAIADFETVIRADARNAGAMVNLAIAQRAARRPWQAQETLIRTIAADGRSAAAHYNLASLYEAAGEFTRALEYYERYLTLADARDEAKQMADVRQRCALLRQHIRQ